MATMTTNLDFSVGQSPTTSEFFAKLTLLLVVWVFTLYVVEKISRFIAAIFWNHPIPLHAARIPSKLPHPNPPGGAVPFDLILSNASDEQIQAFVAFRGKSGRYRKEDEGALQQVADSAAEYKGLLYQERVMKWIDDHFRLHLPNLKYPYVGRHWNGWKSVWLETAPHIRKMFLASMIVIFEHCINGLFLPTLYLLTHDVTYYNLALYGEIAYMIYASTLIALSYALGKDVSIEQQHRSVWPILLAHHIASMVLCIACVMIGESVPRDLVCEILLVLVGLTSSLHYVGVIMDFSPMAQSNAPYTRLYNHVFCLASQIVFRCIYWVKILYTTISHCLEMRGMGTTIAVTSALLLFSLFNVDFIKFHMKATQGCWLKIQKEKIAKGC